MNIALEGTLAKITDRRNKSDHPKTYWANGRATAGQTAETSDRRHGFGDTGWGNAGGHGNGAAEQ